MKARKAGASITLALASMTVMTGCAHLRFWNHQPTAPPLQTGQGTIAKEQQKNQQPAPPSALPQPGAASETTPPELPPPQAPKVKKAVRPAPERHNTPDVNQAQTGPATPASPASSPIGKLTTGDSSDGNQKAKQQDTLTLIRQTEEGLNKLKTLSSSKDRTTAAQAHVFLRQAKLALSAGDTDGASTLATKARLLLDELTGH